MAALKSTLDGYKQLCQEWTKTPPNVDGCTSILANLKVTLTEISYLPMTGATVTKQELLLARDILEIGAQLAVAKEDIPMFERYMAQLKCYYFDYANQDLPESTYRFQLLGLNLLRLLAQNRLAEFHTELELLDAKDIRDNIYIRHPVSLEQYLMEGSYNKVFLAKGNVPAASYNFFMNILLGTIRDEIATCAEKAYDKLELEEAKRMLFFDDKRPLKIYANQRGWDSQGNCFVFRQKDHKKLEPINSVDLAKQAIEYARELEMII